MSDQDSERRLAEVHEGMSVVDVDGEQVGSVKVVQMGDPEAATTRGEGRPSGGLMEKVGSAFTDDDPDVHPQQAARLVRSGYVKIDAGLAHGSRYASAEQVAGVSDGVVRLTVRSAELTGNG